MAAEQLPGLGVPLRWGAARQVGWKGRVTAPSEGAAARGGCYPQGARLSLEKAGGKSTRGRSPLDPRLGKEVPFLRTFSLVGGGWQAVELFLMTSLRPTQRKAPGRAAHHLGGWGRFCFPYGEDRRTEIKRTNIKNIRKAAVLSACLPLCAQTRPRRVRTIGASRPIGGRLALGACRCEGRRPLTPTEHFLFPFAQTREGEREGRRLLPSPPGSRGRSPWCSLSGFLQRKPEPPRERPAPAFLPSLPGGLFSP